MAEESSDICSCSFSTASDNIEYPTIDPTTFDLIVCGTGLQESILAASAASAGKSVLHLDPNPFYGSHFTTLDLPSFLCFLHSSSNDAPSPPLANEELPDDDVVRLRRRSLYSDVEMHGSYPESALDFQLDFGGPRVLYCSDAMVDLLRRSEASKHVNFKSINAILTYWQEELCDMPESKAAIFRDRTLSLVDKGRLIRLLRMIQAHITPELNAYADEEDLTIPAQDLEKPFADFLRRKLLHPKITKMLLYAIALAEYDQEDIEFCKNLILTKDGIESLALYIKSVDRFPLAKAPFLYPIYGHGELPQAFCRRAAVKGALYVLGIPVSALLVNKATRQCKGVRLVTGQDIFSSKVVMESSFEAPLSISPSNVVFEEFKASNLSKKVARGICITTSSILPNPANVLVIFPPKSLFSEQSATVRVLQLSTNVAVSPPDFFVVYLSVPCDDAYRGKQHINAAINALFLDVEDDTFGSDNSFPDNSSPDREDTILVKKPVLKWRIVYVQEQKQASFNIMFSWSTPDETLHYKNLLETTQMIFAAMYPQVEFFPAP